MVQESNEKIISSYLLSHNNDIYIKNKNLSTFSLLFFYYIQAFNVWLRKIWEKMKENKEKNKRKEKWFLKIYFTYSNPLNKD